MEEASVCCEAEHVRWASQAGSALRLTLRLTLWLTLQLPGRACPSWLPRSRHRHGNSLGLAITHGHRGLHTVIRRKNCVSSSSSQARSRSQGFLSEGSGKAEKRGTGLWDPDLRPCSQLGDGVPGLSSERRLPCGWRAPSRDGSPPRSPAGPPRPTPRAPGSLGRARPGRGSFDCSPGDPRGGPGSQGARSFCRRGLPPHTRRGCG